MIRATSVAALMAVAIFGAAVPAMAQVTKPAGISLRAGVFFPSDSTIRKSNKTLFAAGLDYKISNFNMASMGTGTSAYYGISVDYYGNNTARTVPVLLTVTGRNNEFFYTAGAGVGFSRFPVAGVQTNRTRFAYSFGIGYDFQSGVTPFFVEAKYNGSSDSVLNGVAVYAGVRF